MLILNRLTTKRPHFLLTGVWLFLLFPFAICSIFLSCAKDEPFKNASLILKTGTKYAKNGEHIPVGGSIKIGVLASGAGVPLTYIRIDRITNKDTVTQWDRGIFIGNEGFDADFLFSKDTSAVELWRVMAMNSDRDTATSTLTIYKGSGTAYGPINYFENIKLSFQNGNLYGHYLDVNSGNTYSETSVNGHESEIDIMAYYYITSGLPSPTFTCPGYTAATGYFPQIANWPVKNNTLYDYQTSDNNLVTTGQFDAADNDSLLVTAYKSDKVSGNCKYGYTGKVIPFKTQEGKYGLMKVVHADQKDDGVIEISIKVQK